MTVRTLYDFQREGVAFLTAPKVWAGSRGNHRSCGFLWDDPGLGKTIQAIQAAHQVSKSGPILVVCPNSLKGHWRREIAQTFPADAKRILVAGKAGRVPKVVSTNTRTGRVASREVAISPELVEATGARWVIVHYTGLRIAVKAYKTIQWCTIVADECHYIKNKNAARTNALIAVTPQHCNRIGLTATPYSRDPSDLWSQLFWMAPKVSGLHNFWRFFNLFVEYTWEERRNQEGRVVGKYRKIIGGKNLDTLAQVMSTYGVCRRKAEVAKQLPPITETYMPLTLERGSRQLKVLNALKDKDRAELAIKHTGGEGGITGMVIKNVLSRIIKMERWLSCPRDFDPGVKGAKMEWLEEWAKSFPYPAVIVTRFKSSAKYVAAQLGVQAITGDLPTKMRDPIVEKWRGGEGQWLVGTIHTLGTGLNLERAHAMICYDQVYDPILMEQVRHRIHRLTSDHPVEVIYLVVEDTSNEIVYESFKRKWKDLERVKAYLRLLGLNGGKEAVDEQSEDS